MTSRAPGRLAGRATRRHSVILDIDNDNDHQEPRFMRTSHARLADLIDAAFEARLQYAPGRAPAEVVAAVNEALTMLDSGAARVAEKLEGAWHVHQWLKKAVLLSFRLFDNRGVEAGYTRFYDKVALKYAQYDDARFQADGVRVVPPAVVRRGAYVARNAVLMPSYVNIGAYVGEGTMIDTWATVGSCAQIGRNVHLSGGVGIGGVLEPVQANPTIIEDDCFIGARSEVVEGVIVEEGAVLSMGVYVGQSTRIYDRERDEVTYGRIPAGAVVVPGSLPAGNGRYSLYCAVIVKRVDAQTRAKVGINELLRTAE
jgi:2,3,4,5-tetrahydropyridine-2-carboxylate N-succinyltransferase